MSVSVKSITKLYGAQKALDDVSFDVGKGEILGFLGPNGAGKSTMMKIITCYIPPSSGDVEVCGESVHDDTIKVRSNVGYLPEHNPLYLDMYVQEYLTFVAKIHKIKNVKDRVSEMIETVGLGEEQHKLIGALSKGYRQRVGLAQAMIHDPEVLILDEPTSGLDPNQLVEIRELIKRIGKERTVMLSTHIMQEVEAICDRVIIINRGKIVADQRADQIRNSLGKKQVGVKVEFSDAVDSESLLQIEGVGFVRNTEGNNWLIEADGDQDIRKSIFDWAVSHDISVLAMAQQEQSLEDVFKELTRPTLSAQ